MKQAALTFLGETAACLATSALVFAVIVSITPKLPL